MKRRIEKVVVLGAGTMGARIAAHFANAGVPVLLLDIVPPGLTSGAAAERNKIVRAGLTLQKSPGPRRFLLPRWRTKSPLAILKMISSAARTRTGLSRW